MIPDMVSIQGWIVKYKTFEENDKILRITLENKRYGHKDTLLFKDPEPIVPGFIKKILIRSQVYTFDLRRDHAVIFRHDENNELEQCELTEERQYEFQG